MAQFTIAGAKAQLKFARPGVTARYAEEIDVLLKTVTDTTIKAFRARHPRATTASLGTVGVGTSTPREIILIGVNTADPKVWWLENKRLLRSYERLVTAKERTKTPAKTVASV